MIPKKSKVSVREISKKIAKEMIVKHHYSHAWTSCRYALGIFYETDKIILICCFGDHRGVPSGWPTKMLHLNATYR